MKNLSNINFGRTQNSQSDWLNPQYKSKIAANSIKPPTKTSIFYINDLHGQVPKMEQLKTASSAHDSFVTKENIDGLKVSSGDIFIGSNAVTNKTAAKFLGTIGIQYMTPGNHEFDDKSSVFAEFVKGISTKFVGTNLNIPDNSPLKDKLLKSVIHEENGTKYGIIGIQPNDLAKRCTVPENLEGIIVEDKEATIKSLQAEVNELQSQGINKIILLSHAGLSLDKEIAQRVNGIDVINGGHSHDLIEGIQEGINLFYSPKEEPVIITQAGREGQQFGVLNLEFIDGLISKAANNIYKTDDFSKNITMTFIADNIIGPSKKIGILAHADEFPKIPLKQENPYGNFICDAMKSELDADIAILNAGNIRGTLAPGIISTRDIASISPFKNRIVKVKITEKELIEALKLGAKSLTKEDGKPGILYTSGVRYTMSTQGEVLSASYIDKENKESIINVANPSTTKEYVTVYDDFYARGAEGFTMLKKIDNLIEYYNFDKDKTACDYIQKLNNKPFEIKLDGRVKIVN